MSARDRWRHRVYASAAAGFLVYREYELLLQAPETPPVYHLEMELVDSSDW